jgi:hypothetical protein
MAGPSTRKRRSTGRKAKPRANTARRPPKTRASRKLSARRKPTKGIVGEGRVRAKRPSPTTTGERAPAAVTRSRSTRASGIRRIIHARRRGPRDRRRGRREPPHPLCRGFDDPVIHDALAPRSA